MTDNLKRMNQKAFEMVLNYFNGDRDKTYLWFKTKNPNIGGISPIEMIRIGRIKKLITFIESQMKGYGA